VDAEVIAVRALWQLRLDTSRPRRALHARQCAAAEAMLAATATTTTVPALEAALASHGLTAALAGAECLDRYHNRAIVYAAQGDRARCAALGPLDALRGPPVDAPLDGILRAQLIVERALQHATLARAAFMRAIALVIDWHSEPNLGLREVQRLMIGHAWQLARRFDPALTWANLASPYRDRVPFDDRGVAAIGGWLAAALADPGWGLELPPEPAPEAIDPADLIEPTPSTDAHAQASVAARADLAALTSAAPSSAAGQLAAERAGVPVAIARAAILAITAPRRARAAARAQPHIAALGDALADDLAAARTPTELELVGAWHHERLAVEADALGLALQVALRPLVLAVSSDDHPPDALGPALADAAALIGAPWPAIMASPWLDEFCARVVLGIGGEPVPTLEAEAGECGLEHAAAIRSALAEPRSPVARALAAAPPTRAGLAAACAAIAGAAPPPAPAGRLRLFGRDLDLAGLAPALIARRPRLTALADDGVLESP
jgi:hypothetical protein